MKPGLRLFSAISIFLITAVSLFAQDTYKLSYKFEKGKFYFVNSVSSTEMTMSYQGQETTSLSELKSKIRMDITDSSPDLFAITSTVESYNFKITQPTGEETTSNGEDIVGKKANKNYYRNGLSNTSDLSSDTNKTKKNSGGTIQIIIKLPDNPVKIGDTWNSIDSVKNQSENGETKAINNTTFKVEGKETKEGKECLNISFIKNTKSSNTFSQGDVSSISEGETTTKGTLYFDLIGGMVISFEANSDSKQNIEIPERSVSYEATTKTKTSITVTDK